ncbi:MAG: HU family DNA-binding protein [Thermodesulfovibrionales bacterium]
MTKTELVAKMADAAGISKAAAAAAFDELVNSITKTVKKGQKVSILGFGTFSLTKRKARNGRNPRTGEVVKIAARKAPKFTAGKGFKDAVN